MRPMLWIGCVVLGIASARAVSPEFGDGTAQTQSDMKAAADSTLLKSEKGDSAKTTTTGDSCLAIVTVDSLDDGGVSIMLVMRKKAKVDQAGLLIATVDPDTLGTWGPPLAHLVPTGIYDILLQKEGFKDILRRGYEFTHGRDSLSFSFATLQSRRNFFGTLKWISGGISLLAAAASLYLHQKMRTYERQYTDAVDPVVIADMHNKIDQSRALYKTSLGTLGPALAASALFWVIEIEI